MNTAMGRGYRVCGCGPYCMCFNHMRVLSTLNSTRAPQNAPRMQRSLTINGTRGEGLAQAIIIAAMRMGTHVSACEKCSHMNKITIMKIIVN